MIYLYQVKGSKQNKKGLNQPTTNHRFSPTQYKFSLTIDTFYYNHFFRKVNENPQTKT